MIDQVRSAAVVRLPIFIYSSLCFVVPKPRSDEVARKRLHRHLPRCAPPVIVTGWSMLTRLERLWTWNCQGEKDDKIIAVCADDPEYRHYTDIKELAPHRLAEIRRFFEDCILHEMSSIYSFIHSVHCRGIKARSHNKICGARVH